MISNERAWKLLRIAVPIAGLIVIFFSGIFPIEELLSIVSHRQLTASVSSAEVVSLTNENRVEDHLPALTTSALLTQAAQLKAEDMAANSYYAHISPNGKTPLYWLDQVGYHYLNAGENLVIDRTTSAEVVSAWMNSTDHRENILRPQFTEIGVGIAEGIYEGQATTYVVQEFGTPYPNPPLVRKVVAAAPAPVSIPQLPAEVQTESTPATSFKPEPIALPVIPTPAKPKVKVTKQSTNSLVNGVEALATPVSETIQVRVGTSSPVFSLPTASDTVVMVSVDTGTQPQSPPDKRGAPLGEYQTTVGKQRIEIVRTRLQTFWQAFKTLIF